MYLFKYTQPLPRQDSRYSSTSGLQGHMGKPSKTTHLDWLLSREVGDKAPACKMFPRESRLPAEAATNSVLHGKDTE